MAVRDNKDRLKKLRQREQLEDKQAAQVEPPFNKSDEETEAQLISDIYSISPRRPTPPKPLPNGLTRKKYIAAQAKRYIEGFQLSHPLDPPIPEREDL